MHGSHFDEPWRGLPGEIRNAIWELSVCYTDPIMIPDRLPPLCMPGITASVPIFSSGIRRRNLSVLSCCREAHAIASRSLFENNTFLLDCSFLGAMANLQNIPFHHLFTIRHLQLSEDLVTDHMIAPLLEQNSELSTSLIQLLTRELSLKSITIPIYRDYGVAPNEWYSILGRAVWEKRLPLLRLHHLHATPEEANRKGLRNLYHSQQMLAAFRDIVDDKTSTSIRRAYFNVAFGGTKLPLSVLKPMRQKIDDLTWQRRSLCPLSIDFGDLRAGEEGLVVDVKVDVSGARARLRGLEEALRRGYDLDDEEKAMQVMRPESRLQRAKESIDRYEAILASGVWPQGASD